MGPNAWPPRGKCSVLNDTEKPPMLTLVKRLGNVLQTMILFIRIEFIVILLYYFETWCHVTQTGLGFTVSL